MHGLDSETGMGAVDVPALDYETEMEVDWDRELPVSDRAQGAGVQAQRDEEVLESRSARVPVAPSSLYGSFLAGDERDARVLVITFDTSVHGWAAVVRTSRDEPGVENVSGHRTAVESLGAAFINPAALPECSAAKVYREALAGNLAGQAASKQ